MGALTLKTFPFELRGWELKKFKFPDLTDSFGSDINIFLNNKKIIQIEPSLNNLKKTNWLNDKGRQFFDSLTNCFYENKLLNFSLINILKILYRIMYLFNLCNLKNNVFVNYFIIIYENLNNNLIYLLLIFTQKYSFIILKKAEIRKSNNNLQSNFLLNKSLDYNFLKHSNLCLLISNIKFESSVLNLNLKQRTLKGNFKCFLVGSFLNLTYSINFLGTTSISFFKRLAEGNHFICQDLKNSNKPLLIISSELFKRNDSKNIKIMLDFLNILNKNKLKLNILNLSIFETGNFYFTKPKILTTKDLLTFSSLYFINLNSYSCYNFTKLINLNTFYKFKNKLLLKKVVFNQNFSQNQEFLKNINNYIYLPTKTFFETKNIFINTQGIVKNTFNLILNNNNKSIWKIIRNILNNLNKRIKFLTLKNSFKITIMRKNKNINLFSAFLLKTTNKLNKKNTIVGNLNSFFFSLNYFKNLKTKKIKLFDTKLKFWLNDFFRKGKDDLSINSLVMSKCSNMQRLEKTNFF